MVSTSVAQVAEATLPLCEGRPVSAGFPVVFRKSNATNVGNVGKQRLTSCHRLIPFSSLVDMFF